ncbi:outer envelope pore protein 24A, chloroplastic isoform X2 [Ricinus communis]|uniref:outer envelope pore protein 24A, chloroplastic isoform X2 n=1 Tax=Ricinus communis TaxID=3988 RepID=UPI00201A4F0F|nr:outer envelope pore protein 24A, chloroplastic isoform X2 [Ricinus communis]
MIRSAVAFRGNKGVTGTVTANAGDLKLRAVVDNAVFGGSSSTVDVDDFYLSLEKPGSFIVDYDVPNQDVRFQFINTVNVLEKQVNWTYAHSRNENRTVLDGTLVIDPVNKFSARYELGSKNCKLKYSYVHRGVTAFEPGYDLGKNSWDLAVSHRIDSDVIRVSYETVSKYLGVEWSWKSLLTKEGGLKVLASFNLAEGLGMPKLSAESSWNFEM